MQAMTSHDLGGLSEGHLGQAPDATRLARAISGMLVKLSRGGSDELRTIRKIMRVIHHPYYRRLLGERYVSILLESGGLAENIITKKMLARQFEKRAEIQYGELHKRGFDLYRRKDLEGLKAYRRQVAGIMRKERLPISRKWIGYLLGYIDNWVRDISAELARTVTPEGEAWRTHLPAFARPPRRVVWRPGRRPERRRIVYTGR